MAEQLTDIPYVEKVRNRITEVDKLVINKQEHTFTTHFGVANQIAGAFVDHKLTYTEAAELCVHLSEITDKHVSLFKGRNIDNLVGGLDELNAARNLAKECRDRAIQLAIANNS